nr:MAG TPA: hypothetical protein [Caudoviricetes sp.]
MIDTYFLSTRVIDCSCRCISYIKNKKNLQKLNGF